MIAIAALDILNQLNKLIQNDRESVENLIALRVDCGKLQRGNPLLVPHKSEYQRPLVGLLEVLNCLLRPAATIVAVYNTQKQLVRFKLEPVGDVCD